jgi:hypothetical protein
MLKDADSDFPEPGASPEHSNEGLQPKNSRQKRKR